MFYKAPKLIYTVILCQGGNRHFMTAPPPPRGGDRPDNRGEIAKGGGCGTQHAMHTFQPLSAQPHPLSPHVAWGGSCGETRDTKCGVCDDTPCQANTALHCRLRPCLRSRCTAAPMRKCLRRLRLWLPRRDSAEMGLSLLSQADGVGMYTTTDEDPLDSASPTVIFEPPTESHRPASRTVELISGLMVGFLIFAFCNVYATAVYTQHIYLYPFLEVGISQNVLAAVLLCFVSARYAKIAVYIACPDINPTIIHVSIATQLATSIPAAKLPAQLFPTMVAAMAMSSLVVATVTYTLGKFGWTRMVCAAV